MQRAIPFKKRALPQPGDLVEAYDPRDGSFYRAHVLRVNYITNTADLRVVGLEETPDRDWPLSHVFHPREAEIGIEVWEGRRVEVCLPQHNGSWWKGTVGKGFVVHYDDGETLPLERGQRVRSETQMNEI
jgi:hypothetical protein